MNKSLVKQQKTEPHRWQKGESGNPEGRPRKPEIEELRKAIKKVQDEQDSTLLEHLVKRAYQSDQVLIALAISFGK